MFELTGRIMNGYFLSYTPAGKPLVMLELDEKASATTMVDELKDAESLSIKIGKAGNKRSLDANAYCWVLLSKLAAKLGMGKNELYRDIIKEVGDNCDTVCVQNKAVSTLCEGWKHNGLGWLTETFPSKIEGCTNVTLYYGSSTYDTAQMSRLINLVVQECELVGIETKPQAEIDSLLGSWRAK